jgi:4-hydroxy-3-methylbut-2-enyl diphosphate reductase
VVLIGHENHDEVIGTFGEAPDCIHVVSTLSDVDELKIADPGRVVYTTQTTLSLDDTRAIIEHLKERFPFIVSPPTSDICYATQNRQAAVKAISKEADVILVVGAENSSNSNRLVEVARGAGTPAYLIACAGDIRAEWFDGCAYIGVTAGASTPDNLVEQVIEDLKTRGFTSVRELELIREDVHFPLPDRFDEFE